MYLEVYKDANHPTMIDIYDHCGELLSMVKEFEESN